MENNELKELIEAFKSYRNLLSPIQQNLNEFMLTYVSTKSSIDNLNSAFGSGIKENLDVIHKNLSAQAEKASDLASRIDQFVKVTSKFSNDISRITEIFNNMEQRISKINEIENKAQVQIARLDTLMEEKSKSYNLKELQRTLDGYNSNVEKVSEFINKDVGDILTDSQSKLQVINKGIVDIIENQKNEGQALEKLIQSYTTTSAFLKIICEKQDVNEAYLFDMLDKWANERKVKTNKGNK